MRKPPSGHFGESPAQYRIRCERQKAEREERQRQQEAERVAEAKKAEATMRETQAIVARDEAVQTLRRRIAEADATIAKLESRIGRFPAPAINEDFTAAVTRLLEEVRGGGDTSGLADKLATFAQRQAVATEKQAEILQVLTQLVADAEAYRRDSERVFNAQYDSEGRLVHATMGTQPA